MPTIPFYSFEVLQVSLFDFENPPIPVPVFYVTTDYFFFLLLFVFFRVIIFNFTLKNMKRPLSMGYDISLFIFTSVWLITLYTQDFIYYSYDSPIVILAGTAYVASILDFIYNYILYKKQKTLG